MNQRSISTSAFRDAESGRVMDFRGDSTLVAYDPNYTVRVRTDLRTPWDSIRPGWSTDPDDAGPEGHVVETEDHLLDWIPTPLLEPVAEQVRAVVPNDPEARKDFVEAQNRLPETYFAAGMTGLQELYQEITETFVRPG